MNSDEHDDNKYITIGNIQEITQYLTHFIHLKDMTYMTLQRIIMKTNDQTSADVFPSDRHKLTSCHFHILQYMRTAKYKVTEEMASSRYTAMNSLC